MSTIHPKLSSCNDSEPVIQRQLEAISNDINMIKEVVCGKLYVFARMKDRTLNIGFTDDLPTRKDYWESKGFKFIDSTSYSAKAERRLHKRLKDMGFNPKFGREQYELTSQIIKVCKRLYVPIGNLEESVPHDLLKSRNRSFQVNLPIGFSQNSV